VDHAVEIGNRAVRIGEDRIVGPRTSDLPDVVGLFDVVLDGINAGRDHLGAALGKLTLELGDLA
jgi:hypothetical protein